MIVYKDILPRLSKAGWPAPRLRREKVFSESTMANIRHGGVINTNTIDKICRLLQCPVEDVLCYVPDEGQGN